MIIPLNVATDGYLGCESKTLAIASNGYLCTIIIENVVPPGGYLVKGLSRNLRRKERERREKYNKEDHKEEYEEELIKKITVIVTFNNKEYIETKYVSDMPDLTVDDVDIEIVERDEKPKITITVIKK